MIQNQFGNSIVHTADGYLVGLGVEDEKRDIKHTKQVDRLRNKLNQRKKDKGEICCFCSDPDIGFGNNPSTRNKAGDKKLNIKHTHRCCDDCNREVIKLRVWLSQK